MINPIVNPAHILPVNGIPKLVIANEEAVAVAWISLLELLIPVKRIRNTSLRAITIIIGFLW